MVRAATLAICLVLIVDAYWCDSKYTVAFVQMTRKIAASY